MLIFSEHLQGKDAQLDRDDGDEEHSVGIGFKWLCPAAAKMLDVWPNSTVARVTHDFQMEAINSDSAFSSGREETAEQIVARAGQRTWRLSFICFNPTNQSVYHLLDDATPKPDYSGMGGPGGWTTEGIAFSPQPLRLVFQEGEAGTQQGHNAHMINPDWHAHASISPAPQAPQQDGAAPPASAKWYLHFNLTNKEEDTPNEWSNSPEFSNLVLTALENLNWA